MHGAAMLTVCCWRWGGLFGPEYVNRLRVALERHLHIPHQLVCVTDDPRGIDPWIRIVQLPKRHADTPRCRRRMRQFDSAWALDNLGPRILSIDLDVVIVDDLTPVVDRPEPIVGWKVGHAGVYSGSFLLYDAAALRGAWLAFDADPEGFPFAGGARGVPSDQAMLNHYVAATATPVATWTEADGFVTYYGRGYAHLQHLGVGPACPRPPAGARIIVLGSADKAVMDEGLYPWVREHWTALPGEARPMP